MLSLIKKIVGTKNDREIKRIRPYVDDINALEPEYQRLSDMELRAQTDQFKKRLIEATAELKKELEEAQGESAGADFDQREEVKARSEELDKARRAMDGADFSQAGIVHGFHRP